MLNFKNILTKICRRNCDIREIKNLDDELISKSEAVDLESYRRKTKRTKDFDRICKELILELNAIDMIEPEKQTIFLANWTIRREQLKSIYPEFFPSICEYTSRKRVLNAANVRHI